MLQNTTCIVSAPGRDAFKLPVEMVDDLVDCGFVILGDDRLYHVTPDDLTEALQFPE